MDETVFRKFDEAEFLTGFQSLIAEAEGEAALDHYIARLPGLNRSGMNRKEKLKHLLFAGRLLQQAGLGKHGYRKLLKKVQGVQTLLATHPPASYGTFVDFGCGTHEPLALSTFLYANGFERCIANDFLPLRNPAYSALSMYDVIVNMLVFPDRYLMEGASRERFLRRLSQFDLEGFEAGDFEAGMAPLEERVAFRSCDIVEAGIAPGSVSFLVSFAVFEHVMDMEAVVRLVFDVMEPGGIGYHFIDLADHRAYRHDGAFGPFSFLTEEVCAPNLNRLRKSEHIAAFEAAGFEILNVAGNRVPVDEQTRAQFLPRFAAMSAEDQETRSMNLTIRKPL